LLTEREAARAARDYVLADARRDQLAARGWEVRDTPEGPRLVRRGHGPGLAATEAESEQ
jgi:cysteinyl-tRNA synthetase